MPVSVPPTEALREFLGATTRHTRRIEIYEQDGITRWAKDTTPRLKSGQVTVDYSRDERRALDLTLSNDDGALINAPGEFWYDKIIKVFRGVRIDEPTRVPKILVLSDKTGTDQMAPSFRELAVNAGFGDVQVNTVAASYDVDVAPYDIIVGLGAATVAQTDLLVQAYQAGKSVFVQDADSVKFIEELFPTASSSFGTDNTIAPRDGANHQLASGWASFDTSLLFGRTNLVPNPKPSSGSGSVEYRRNYMIEPVPTSTTSYNFLNGTDGASSLSFITGATDGPLPGVTQYRRSTITTPKSSGYYGWYDYFSAPGPVAVGEKWTGSVYVRSSVACTMLLDLWGSTGGALQGVGATGLATAVPANEWVRLSVTLTATAAADGIFWWARTGDDLPVGATIDTTAVLIEKTDQVLPYFDGSTTYYPLLVPSWKGTPGASASVLTANIPSGWAASPDETAILVTDDDGEPCVELIDPVGGGGGYIWVLNGTAATPGVGRWVALGVDVKPLTEDQASRMRLYVRTQSGSTTVDEQYSPTGVGWTAGQWTRQVVSVQQTGAADNIDAIIWPDYTPNPGAQFRARRAVVAFADTKEKAEAAVETYFDGDMADTNDFTYTWEGAANASPSIATSSNAKAYSVPSPQWTSIASAPWDSTKALVSAFVEPVFRGRAVALSFPINFEQYDVLQFQNLVRTALHWLNTVTPLVEWEVQIGEFMIDRISEPHFPHEVKVTGRDYTKKCMLSKFTQATSFTSGISLESVIAAIAGAAGIVKRLLPATGIVIGRTFFFEAGVTRWDAMKEIATAYDHELFFDAQGYLILRPYNDPATTPPILYIETGKEGQIASYEKSTTDARIYNHVIVRGESGDKNTLPVWAEAKNQDPNSPTSIQELGDRVFEYTSAFIQTTQQAQELADSLLAIHSLEEFELNFESLMLPWVEVGDILGWVDPNPAPGDPTTFLLSQITLPLELAPMSGTARRVTNVGV